MRAKVHSPADRDRRGRRVLLVSPQFTAAFSPEALYRRYERQMLQTTYRARMQPPATRARLAPSMQQRGAAERSFYSPTALSA